MPSYPPNIRRCQHLKVNGTQCGSPALREEKYCYFHMRWHASKMSVILKEREHWIAGLPTLEDANSIQVGLAEVMRLLVTQEIDSKTGALLLYAMQTASTNLKWTSFEPDPTLVVIDRECVERRPIGATAWSVVEGREYDELKKAELAQADSTQADSTHEVSTREGSKKDAVDPEEAERGRKFMASFKDLTDGLERDPKYLDRRLSELGGRQDGRSSSAGEAAGPTAESLPEE